MKHIFERLPEEFRQNSRTLTQQGVEDIVWPAASIVDVLKALGTLCVAVLGGDVYERRGDWFEPTYDSWHCDRAVSESFQVYSQRSVMEALRYINAHARLRDAGMFIGLVVTDDLASGFPESV